MYRSLDSLASLYSLRGADQLYGPEYGYGSSLDRLALDAYDIHPSVVGGSDPPYITSFKQLLYYLAEDVLDVMEVVLEPIDSWFAEHRYTRTKVLSEQQMNCGANTQVISKEFLEFSYTGGLDVNLVNALRSRSADPTTGAYRFNAPFAIITHGADVALVSSIAVKSRLDRRVTVTFTGRHEHSFVTGQDANKVTVTAGPELDGHSAGGYGAWVWRDGQFVWSTGAQLQTRLGEHGYRVRIGVRSQ